MYDLQLPTNDTFLNSLASLTPDNSWQLTPIYNETDTNTVKIDSGML